MILSPEDFRGRQNSAYSPSGTPSFVSQWLDGTLCWETSKFKLQSSGKLQTPTSNIQRRTKHRPPRAGYYTFPDWYAAWRLVLGAWSFSGCWMLELPL